MIKKLGQFGWIFAFAAWLSLALTLTLLRFDSYGIDESAAQAILVTWSIFEQVANPIVILGAPDFRIILLAPLGLYWPGSIVAAKIFAAMTAFGSIFFIYKWLQRNESSEAALISAGLLLVSPALFSQINSMGVGPFLLLAFGVGLWLHKKHLQAGKPLSAWYFLQLLNVVFTTSLHPIGLAYPAALAWQWRKNPLTEAQQKHIWIGIPLAVIFAIYFRQGWYAIDWLKNPLQSLGSATFNFFAVDEDVINFGWGLAPAVILLYVLFKDRNRIKDDLYKKILLLAVVIGLVAADNAWALIALTFIICRGIPLLINFNQARSIDSLLGQRGLVLLVIFFTATLFMIGDKTLRGGILRNALSSQDRVIQSLSSSLEDEKQAVNTSSQWPAKTMLATKHPSFPLPPAAKSNEDFVKSIKGISYVLFNPYDNDNREVAKQLSQLSSLTETILLEEDAVLIYIRNQEKQKQANPAAP